MKDNNKKFSAFNLSDGQNADNRADSVSANHVTSCRSFLYEDESQGGHYIYFYRAGSALGASRDPDLSVGTNGSGSYAAEPWQNRISSNYYSLTGC